MSSRRPVILMAVLLLLVGAYVALPYAQDRHVAERASGASGQAAPGQAPAQENRISSLTVTRAADGRWLATVEYSYTGSPAGAMLRLFHTTTGAGPFNAYITERQFNARSAAAGTYRVTTELPNPSVYDMYITEKVTALLDVAPAPPLAKVTIDHRIQWPDPVLAQVELAVAAGKPETVVETAAGLIDREQRDDWEKARTLLQALVDKAPNTDAAYVELARLALRMKGNGGLHEAETLLGSALQLRPDSANARILLGHVYSHQQRYPQAEAMFAAVAPSDPPNLWLWSNWGLLLVRQGKTEAAIAKYREAVARPKTGNSYDRARWEAYDQLTAMLQARNDLDGTEALLKQRATEYAGTGCFATDYARFLVLYRGNAEAGLSVLRDMPSPRCEQSVARAIQGLAYYLAWSQGQEPQRAETLRQARVSYPVGPGLFYTLARSDHGTAVARQLIAAGEKVDMRDEKGLAALAHALRNKETGMVARLLRLGANPLAEAGPEGMPAALIPVITRDFDSIRVLQRSGVDYTKVRFQGTSAVEYARSQGDTKLQRLLDPRSGKL